MILRPHRLLAWYGDDFTGSTDVMEVVSLQGIPAVLFLEKPSEEALARFAGYRAFGLAGSSRSQSPQWMDAHLPGVFEWMRGLGAALSHYKVCSTFDSSPDTGSIGRALEIGARIFRVPWVPIVVGAPALRRYTAFGHLFATSDGAVKRIDRHPMARHPVTPMLEADLRLHLARQTDRRVALMSLLDLASPDPEARMDEVLRDNPDAVLFDVLDEASLRTVGRLLWGRAFAVGSSGVEYALAAHWQLPPLAKPQLQPADRIVVLSGSCSPVTGRQIREAERRGFASIRVDPLHPVLDAAAVQALKAGRSAVIYTAAGPEDQLPAFAPRENLGRELGRMLAQVLEETGVRRVIVAGGDTSSHAGGMLQIDALTFICPLAPGAPLCRAWSSHAGRDGIEIVFKGGQCGNDDFFCQVRGDR